MKKNLHNYQQFDIFALSLVSNLGKDNKQ